MSGEPTHISILGMSISDVLGLGLGFMAIVLTLVALAASVVIFFLGTRHSRHLAEIEKERRELMELNEGIKKDVLNNSYLLKEVHLAFGIILLLINLKSQERKVQSVQHNLINQISRESELSNIRDSIKARELELHILANEGLRCRASMQGLAYTFGDRYTIDFFRKYAPILESRGEDSRDIYEALGLMQGRLSKALH